MGVCNKTLGHGRCLSGGCFDLNRTCDGVIDCPDGFDEAMCKLSYNPYLCEEIPGASLNSTPIDRWKRLHCFLGTNLYLQTSCKMDNP